MPIRHALVVLVSSALLTSAQPPQSNVRPKHIVALEYPHFARLGAVEGTVEIIATVSRDGKVTDARIVSGEAPLSIPAKNALSKWLFTGCEDRAGCALRVYFSFTLMPGLCIAGRDCPTEFEMDLPDRVSIRAQPFRAIVD